MCVAVHMKSLLLVWIYLHFVDLHAARFWIVGGGARSSGIPIPDAIRQRKLFNHAAMFLRICARLCLLCSSERQRLGRIGAHSNQELQVSQRNPRIPRRYTPVTLLSPFHLRYSDVSGGGSLKVSTHAGGVTSQSR